MNSIWESQVHKRAKRFGTPAGKAPVMIWLLINEQNFLAMRRINYPNIRRGPFTFYKQDRLPPWIMIAAGASETSDGGN